MRRIGLGWKNSSDVATLTLVLPARNILPGSQIRLFSKHETTGITVASVTDSTGTTYSLVGAQTAAGASTPGAAAYYAPTHPGGIGVVITITYSASTAAFVRAFAEEWDTGGATGVQVALVTGTGTGTAYSTAALSAVRPGVAWGGVAGFTALTNITAGGTPTGLIGDTLTDSFTWWRPTGGPQTITPGASATGSNAWVMLVAVFEDGTAIPRRRRRRRHRISGHSWFGAGAFDKSADAAAWFWRGLATPATSGTILTSSAVSSGASQANAGSGAIAKANAVSQSASQAISQQLAIASSAAVGQAVSQAVAPIVSTVVITSSAVSAGAGQATSPAIAVVPASAISQGASQAAAPAIAAFKVAAVSQGASQAASPPVALASSSAAAQGAGQAVSGAQVIASAAAISQAASQGIASTTSLVVITSSAESSGASQGVAGAGAIASALAISQSASQAIAVIAGVTVITSSAVSAGAGQAVSAAQTVIAADAVSSSASQAIAQAGAVISSSAVSTSVSQAITDESVTPPVNPDIGGGGGSYSHGGMLHRYKLLQAFKDKQERDAEVSKLPKATERERVILRKSARALIKDEPVNYKELENRVSKDLESIGLVPAPHHLDWLLYFLRVEAYANAKAQADMLADDELMQVLLMALME